MVIRRGDIYYADLRPVVGSEQGGVRPVLIIQNDMGNTIDKQRLREKVCHLEEDMIRQIDEALRVSLDITRT